VIPRAEPRYLVKLRRCHLNGRPTLVGPALVLFPLVLFCSQAAACCSAPTDCVT
jgi:hypothetical protein